MSDWQPIETAPHDEILLLYCPDRGCSTNPERFEVGYATREKSGYMSAHPWATHWMRLNGLAPEAWIKQCALFAKIKGDE
jgi:hypothetical protein